MRFLPFHSRRSPIGIDIGGRMIKAVQLARSGSAWRVHAAITLPLPVVNHPVDAPTVRHFREVLHRHGFTGDNIVLAAPTAKLAVDMLELPPRSSGAPVEQIARMEIARAAKLESEPFEMNCWDLPNPARGAAGTSVMAVALRHVDASELLDPFEAGGFNVLAIDARCCALARACSPYDTPGTTTAILDLGWNSALITLVRDGTVLYQRSLVESGLGVLFGVIANEFALAEDETEYVISHVGAASAGVDSDLEGLAQARQIQQLITRHLDSIIPELDAAIHYARHRYPEMPVAQLFLVGGGSAIAGACALFASRLTLSEVKVLRPALVVECPEKIAARYNDGTITTALGLAWKGAA